MLLAQHTAKAVLAVGLRQKALLQPIRVHLCSFAVKKKIESVIIRAIRGKINKCA